MARQWLAWSRSLRTTGYDLVYDLQGLARSGLITWQTRAPRRVGFADAREAGYLGYTHRHKIPAAMHTVDRMLALLEADGVPAHRDMRLYVPDEATQWWNDTRVSTGLKNQRYAVLAPTSRWTSKRWPADRFVQLANHLLASGFERIAIVGGKDERSQIEPLLELARTDDRINDLVGQTTVGGLMAVIAGGSLIVANDSASLHMAVGFVRPYVALFGPTDVALVGPYRGEQWVIQPPVDPSTLSHKDASLGSSIMERITVAEVIERIDQRLAAPAENPQ